MIKLQNLDTQTSSQALNLDNQHLHSNVLQVNEIKRQISLIKIVIQHQLNWIGLNEYGLTEFHRKMLGCRMILKDRGTKMACRGFFVQ